MEPYPLQHALTALSTQRPTLSGTKGVKLDFHKYFHIPFFLEKERAILSAVAHSIREEAPEQPRVRVHPYLRSLIRAAET